MRWPLRRKLFLTMGTGAGLLAVVVSLLVDRTVAIEARKNEERGLERARAAFESLQEYRQARLLERCRLISDLPYFKAAAAVYDPDVPMSEQTEALETVADVARRILSRVEVDLLVLSDLDGNPLIAVGPAAEDEKDIAGIDAIAKRGVRQGFAEGILPTGAGLLHLIAVPLNAGGRELGSLCLGTNLSSKLANSLESMTGSAIALLGPKGLLASSDGVPEGAGPAITALWRTQEAGQPEGPSRVVIDGASFRALLVPLGDGERDPRGAFVVLRSEDDALAFLAEIRRGLILIALVALAVALVVSFLFSRHITVPMGKLVTFTERVASGDLTTRAEVETGDEVTVLAGAFNRMTEGLLESRQRLEATYESLASRTDQLESANKDLSRSQEETLAANKALRETHAQLLQAGKMAALGELGAGIAHELRQPLSSIRGFAQLLKMKLHDEADSRKYSDLIVDSVDHMTQIVQGLRDFSRKASFEFKDVDVNAVIERTRLLLAGQLQSKQVALMMDLDPAAPPVLGDHNQLQQVFTNLLTNAKDALGSRGGKIRIETRTIGDGSYVLVSVEDDGPGIPAEAIPRIFTSFYTTKPEGQGTGLGLSITQGIVHDHGGRIDVVSRPGEGATFRIFLPTRESKPCWEMIDCVRDCRPEISGKEECAIYRERKGHRCWIALRELGAQNPEVARPDCEACPVFTAKTTFVVPSDPDRFRRAA